MRKLSFAVLCILALLAAGVGAQAVQYQMIDLSQGTANSDLLGVDRRAFGINNSGQVVGANGYAFLWQNGTMTNLCSGFATDINSKGQIVGSYIAPENSSHAFLWQDGVLTDLGAETTWASGINDNGQVIGQHYGVAGSAHHAWLWQNGTKTDLYTGLANGINDSGQVVGHFIPAGGYGQYPVLWQNDVTTRLDCNANAINNNGQIVGMGGGGACILQNGTVTTLIGIQAWGINNFGQVVGENNNRHACIWQNGEMTDLGSLGGYSCAYAINDNGWIVGYANEANGNMHAVLWTPVPEPSSILVLLCGISGMSGILLRRKLT